MAQKKAIEKIENLCQGKFYSYPFFLSFFVKHLVMLCVRVLAAGQYNEVMCYIDCSGCCERHLQAFVVFTFLPEITIDACDGRGGEMPWHWSLKMFYEL